MPKKWPSVANRHRTDSIFKAGQIRTEAKRLQHHLPQLRQAVQEGNIALCLAIISTIEAQAKLLQETAEAITLTLESAPAHARNGPGPEDQADD